MKLEIRVHANILAYNKFIRTELSGITSPIAVVHLIVCSKKLNALKLLLKYTKFEGNLP